MVQLGNGLAIIGGHDDGYRNQDKIYLLNCLNRNCSISTLSQELSKPRQLFLAIPIPDAITGCISGGKKSKKEVPDLFIILVQKGMVFGPFCKEICDLASKFLEDLSELGSIF